MLWTAVRSTEIAHSIKKLLPSQLPPSLSSTGNLYEVLSRSPDGGVGKKIHQVRWSHKQIGSCYWLVTRSRFKSEGKHGRAWGMLYWRDQCVSEKEQRIRGSLKYTWKEGISSGKSTAKSV